MNASECTWKLYYIDDAFMCVVHVKAGNVNDPSKV